MYFSSSLSNLLLSVPFLAVVAINLLSMCSASSVNLTNTYLHHTCLVSQGKYIAGSAYEENLNSLIRMVSEGTFRKGFTHITYGSNPDSVTIISQCRGDSYWSKCRPCFNAAISGLRRRCPLSKGGIIWFDQCFAEITAIDVAAFKEEIDYVNIFSLHNRNKVSGDARLFNKETVALLEKLTLKANDKSNVDDKAMSLYAAEEKRLGTKTLYAMVQCTRFLFMDEEDQQCKVCLQAIIRMFPKCCDGRQGGRVLSTSCNFRYEIYPFIRTEKTV